MVYLKDFGLSSIISFLWTFINRKMKLQNSVKGTYKDQQSRDIIAVQECILFLFRTECTERERERERLYRDSCVSGAKHDVMLKFTKTTLFDKR